jgi:heme/copper-type cytochrome/quinol oxidase subunit 4
MASRQQHTVQTVPGSLAYLVYDVHLRDSNQGQAMNKKAIGVLLLGTFVTGFATVMGSGYRPTVAWAFFFGLAIIAVGCIMLAASWFGAKK